MQIVDTMSLFVMLIIVSLLNGYAIAVLFARLSTFGTRWLAALWLMIMLPLAVLLVQEIGKVTGYA